MKIKYILNGFMFMALLLLPAISMANTYHFIDTSGNRQSMEASNSAVALATAHQLGIHSGVMMMEKGDSVVVIPIVTPGSGNYYHFIDTSGNLKGMWAVNSSVALDTAYQLGIHSGVMLVKQ